MTDKLSAIWIAILVFVSIGIFLGIGFMVLDEVRETMGTSSATGTNVTTLATVSTSGTYTQHNSTTAGINCFHNFEVSACINASSRTLVPASNYTYDRYTGRIAYTSGSTGDVNNLWNCTYTYQYGGEGCGGVGTTITATQSITTWLGLIVIMFIVGVLIYLVFRYIAGRGGGGTVAEI